MNFSNLHMQRKLVLLCAAAGIIAVFLPWITVSAGIFGQSISRSTNGFHGAGILVFLAFAGALVIALTGTQSAALEKNTWFGALGCGAAALLGLVIFFVGSSGSMGNFGLADAGFGFGVWIALVAAVGILFGTWRYKAAGDTLQGGFDSLKKSIATMQNNVTPAASNNTAAPDKIKQIEKLAALKEEGKITDQEYQDLKAKLLG